MTESKEDRKKEPGQGKKAGKTAKKGTASTIKTSAKEAKPKAAGPTGKVEARSPAKGGAARQRRSPRKARTPVKKPSRAKVSAAPPPQPPKAAGPIGKVEARSPAKGRAVKPAGSETVSKAVPSKAVPRQRGRIKEPKPAAKAEVAVPPPSGTVVPPAQAPARPPSEAKPAPLPPERKVLEVSAQVTVRELADKLQIRVNDLIKKLMSGGVYATINQRLDSEAAELVAHDYGYDLKIAELYGHDEIQAQLAQQKDKPENLKPRTPVVTIMGHVDHGKTSLLDAFRESKIVEKEAGGMTQHIGAYKVAAPKGKIIFLDTPGHEAFTAMRSRGASATDIVVLVVSAVDGVMPQTVEAIDHAKAANAPIMVAVNKIDLPNASPEKVKRQLTEYGLVPEEWGGQTIMVDVSAKKRINLEKLLEMILLQAEILEIKANPERPGVGVVLEARLDPKKGSVASILVQHGTVSVGDSFVVGTVHGRVRAMIDDQGRRVEKAGPSTPIEVLGISGAPPQAGDIFNVVSSDRQARDIAAKRGAIHREEAFAHQKQTVLTGLKSKVDQRLSKELKLILKADVQGSLQAIRDLIEKLATHEIGIRFVHTCAGNVNESDILLAKASEAVILAFHVDVPAQVRESAEKSGVEIRTYDIIFELSADVKAAMEGLLEPEVVEVTTGRLEVRQVFQTRQGKVAGCFVVEGKVERGSNIRLLRGREGIFQGRMSGLKRFKDDVREVEKGFECGLCLEGFQDFRTGDILEVITKQEKSRRLSEGDAA